MLAHTYLCVISAETQIPNDRIIILTIQRGAANEAKQKNTNELRLWHIVRQFLKTAHAPFCSPEVKNYSSKTHDQNKKRHFICPYF